MVWLQYSGFPLSWAVGITWLRDQPRPKPQVLWGKMVGSTEYRSQWLLEVNMDHHELFNSSALLVRASVIHFSSLLAKHIHSAEEFLLPLQVANLNLAEYKLYGSALQESIWTTSKDKMRLHCDSTNNPAKAVSKYITQVMSHPDNPISGNWKLYGSITHCNS